MKEQLYFNSKDNSELTDRIFELINNAKECIKTGNFFFKDQQINEALLKAASRGVAVFVLSNINSLTDGASRGIKDTGTKVETDPHIGWLHQLQRNGVHVRLCNDLHAKFIISDNNEGLIMSANYANDSLRNNPEDGVDIIGNELKDLRLIFDTIYLHPDTILLEENSEYRYINKHVPVPAKAFDNVGKISRLILTAHSHKNSNLRECNYLSIYNTLVRMVTESEEFITIVSWSYNQVAKLPNLRNAIRNALKRGVKVKLYYSQKGEDKKIEQTKRAIADLVGIEQSEIVSQEMSDNHAKCIITEKAGAMFTANIDGFIGLLNGFELGCILTEEQRKNAIIKINNIIENGK